MELDIILLAGGGSRRFARSSREAGGRKLLALWRGAPLFHWALEAVSPPPPGCRVLVVTREEEIAAEARRRGFLPVEAPPPDEGIAASVRAGVAAARAGAALCFFVCDQPSFPRALFARFIEGFRASGLPLGRVRAGDRMGSPAAFRPEFRGELLALRGDEGGRTIFRGREDETFFLEVPEGCLEDWDVPWSQDRI